MALLLLPSCQDSGTHVRCGFVLASGSSVSRSCLLISPLPLFSQGVMENHMTGDSEKSEVEKPEFGGTLQDLNSSGLQDWGASVGRACACRGLRGLWKLTVAVVWDWNGTECPAEVSSQNSQQQAQWPGSAAKERGSGRQKPIQGRGRPVGCRSEHPDLLLEASVCA